MQISDNWSSHIVSLTINKYVCGTCWAKLTEIRRDHHSYVVCSRYPDNHEGFVTAAYADRARQNDKEDFYEVKDMLLEAGIIKRKKLNLTSKQIIDSLY